MKKQVGWMCIMLVLICCCVPALAGGRSEEGDGIVLCQSLTVRDHPSANAVDTLYYGDRFTDLGDGFDGYLHIRYGKKEGWVDERYVALNPAYFVTQKATPAYAWGDCAAPRVALLDKGERLPVLHETEAFYVVSLRGASAWIEKEAPAAVFEQGSAFEGMASVTLRYVENGNTVNSRTLTDAFSLGVLRELFSDVQPVGFATNCPFGVRLLDVTCADGSVYTLDIAADDCRVFCLNGVYWEYGASREGIYSDILFSLFD